MRCTKISSLIQLLWALTADSAKWSFTNLWISRVDQNSMRCTQTNQSCWSEFNEMHTDESVLLIRIQWDAHRRISLVDQNSMRCTQTNQSCWSEFNEMHPDESVVLIRIQWDARRHPTWHRQMNQSCWSEFDEMHADIQLGTDRRISLVDQNSMRCTQTNQSCWSEFNEMHTDESVVLIRIRRDATWHWLIRSQRRN